MILQNEILSKLQQLFNKLKGGNTNLYSKAIGYYYPIINSLENIEETFIELFKNIKLNKFQSNLISVYTKYNNYFIDNSFKINIFNKNVNRLNGLMFLYYYLKNNTENEKIEIPKFLYHQLGNNPLIIFDKGEEEIAYPGKENQEEDVDDGDDEDVDYEISEPYPKNKNMEGQYSYTTSNNYFDIIKRIEDRKFFIGRDILDQSFIIDKKSSLPPSLIAMYSDFLKFTIIKICKRSINENINVPDELINIIPHMNDIVKNIQKKYLIAIYTEENIIENLKNKIYDIGYKVFSELVKSNKNIQSDIFSTIKIPEFNIESLPINDYTNDITEKNIEFILKKCKFTEDIDDIIKIIKKQFKLYSNNYNSLNLNKKFYQINIKNSIILLLVKNNCNIF